MLYDYSIPRTDVWMDEFENGASDNSVDEFAWEVVALVATEGPTEGLPIAVPIVGESYRDDEQETIEWVMGGVNGAIVGIVLLCCGSNRIECVIVATVVSLVVQRLL